MRVAICTLFLSLFFSVAKAQDCDIAMAGVTVVNATNTATIGSIYVGEQANFKFKITNEGVLAGCTIPANSVTAIFDFPTISGPIKPYVYNGPPSFISGYFTWTYNSGAEVLVGTNTTAIPNGMGDLTVLVPVVGNAVGSGNSNLNLTQGFGISNGVGNDVGSAQLVVMAAFCDIATTPITVVNDLNTVITSICVGQQANFKFSISNAGTGCEIPANSVDAIFDFPASTYTYNGPLSFVSTYFTWTYNNIDNVLEGINTTAIPSGAVDMNISVPVLGNSPGTGNSNINLTQGLGVSNDVSNDNDVAQLTVYALPSAPVITATNSTCQPGCTVGGGLFNITTSCGVGTALTYYSDNTGSNPTTTAPVYNQTTAMTIYYACVDNTTGCSSAIQTLTTVPGSCTTTSVPVITATNSTCQPGCTVGGGSFNITTSCGAGTTLTYYTDNTGATTTGAPVYNQTTAMTIYYACVDNTTGCSSAIQTLTTVPGSCTTPSVPVITATNSTCQPGCTVGGGSFNITTSCGIGTTLTYYSDNTGSNPTTTAPVYNQTTAMTIYYACVDNTTGCSSAIQTLTTVPGSCTTPSVPVITATNSTCQPGCTVGGGSFNITTSCGIGTTLTYYSYNTGSNPTTTAPVYNQTTAMTIYYACVDNTTGCSSAIQTLTTTPGSCTTASAPVITATNSTCQPGCTVGGGSFNITTSCGTGTTLTYYTDNTGTTTTGAPVYNQTTAMTIYYACVDNITGCRSAIQTLTTVPGSCTTPAAPTCPVNMSVCLNTAPFALGGATPSGGTYSGVGVSAGQFNPATAGVGPHTITYTYSNGTCSNICTFTITVNPAVTPAVSIAASPSGPICAGTSVTFTATASNLGGGTVSNYDFKVNGISQQSSASNTYTTTSLANGNTVTCEITITGGSCLTSATATSNTITMSVNASCGCTLTVNAGPDKVLCNASCSVTLTASVAGVSAGTTPATPFTEVSGSTSDKRIFSGNINHITIGNTFSQSEDRNNCNKNPTSAQTLTIPAGAVVKKAYLYWSGSGNLDNQVKLNGTSVTADGTKTYTRSGGFCYFGARKDVTSLVTVSGTYTVSDLNWSNGSPYCYDNSAYGGWAMTIVYELASLPAARIHINTEKFQFTYPAATYSTTINNVSVSTGCNANAELTIVAFEGDSYKGEKLRIAGVLDADPNNFRGQAGPNLDIITRNAPSLVGGTTSLTYSIESDVQNTVFGSATEGLFDYVKVLKYNYCPAPVCNVTYQWKKGAAVVGTTQSISVSTAGTYIVTATDCAGCTATDEVIVTASTLTALASVGTITCHGGTTTVTITATGGTAPYTGTGTFTRDAGTCSFTVTDAKGCTKTISVTITEPSALVLTATAPLIPCGGTTTTVTVSASGGTAGYTGIGTFTKGPGTWTFTVTDANGCIRSKTIVIANPSCGPVDPDKCYKLIARHSGKALTVESSSTADGGDVIQKSYNGGSNQIWKFVQVETGYYEVINVNSGKVLDVAGASTANGANIQQWTWNSGNNQKWSLTGTSSYYIVKAKHSGKAMSVEDGSTSNGADVIQKGTGSNTCEQWSIIEVGCPNINYRTAADPVVLDEDKDNEEEIIVPAPKRENKTAPPKEQKTRIEANLDVRAQPNPSVSYFNLIIKSSDNITPVDLKIFDVNSKIVSTHFRLGSNSIVRIDSDKWATGVYFAEVMQGGERKVIQLIKVN